MYQAGTLSGNPLAMAAGLATLRALDTATYARLEATSAILEDGLRKAVAGGGVAARVVRVASLLTVFFDDDDDGGAFARFFHAMLDAGVLLPPSPQEAWFVSAAHGDEELQITLEAASPAFGRAAARA